MKPKTKESARTYCNILSSYLQWGIENRHSEHLTNPIRKKQDFFYQFIEEKKLFISYEEKEAILYGLENEQDQFIVQALWEGIQGQQVSELINLKLEDFITEDGKNYSVVIRDNNGEVDRIIPVDSRTYSIAKLANSETIYEKKNGLMKFELKDNDRLKSYVELPESKYIMKTVKNKANADRETVSFSTIYNRIEMIKNLEEFEEYREALTTKNIVRSGMIYEAYKIVKSGRILDKMAIEEICEKYGMQYKWSMKDYLNYDKIEELYGHLPNMPIKETAL